MLCAQYQEAMALLLPVIVWTDVPKQICVCHSEMSEKRNPKILNDHPCGDPSPALFGMGRPLEELFVERD